MINIIVTGGCGFIGSNICEFLKKKNFNVISVDNLSKNYSKINERRLLKLKIKNFCIDISKKNFLKLKFRAKFIIDCCADPSVESSRINRLANINNNLITTLNVLEKAKRDNSKLIFLSTSRVYPIKDSYKKFTKSRKNNFFDENSNIVGAKTIYGYTKISSEMLINEFNYAFGLEYIVNRCGLVTGPWQFGRVEQGLVSLWLWNHFNKKDNNLSYKGYDGSGKQIRDILFIDDLKLLIHKQIKKFNKIKNSTFVVGGGYKNTVNLIELTKICQELTGNKIMIRKSKSTSIYDIPFYITSSKKLKKYYGWEPKIDLYTGIKQLKNWMKINYSLIRPFFK
jgi:CDP-paratose 2-epimerase